MKQRLVPILTFLAMVAVATSAATVAAVRIVQKDLGSAVAAAPLQSGKAEVGSAVMVALEPFVTDLADRVRPRYLEVRLVLEVDQATAGQVQEQMAHVRDAVLDALRVQTAADLNGAGGKAHLANAVSLAVREVLPRDGVHRVLVTDMVIQ